MCSFSRYDEWINEINIFNKTKYVNERQFSSQFSHSVISDIFEFYMTFDNNNNTEILSTNGDEKSLSCSEFRLFLFLFFEM